MNVLDSLNFIINLIYRRVVTEVKPFKLKTIIKNYYLDYNIFDIN